MIIEVSLCLVVGVPYADDFVSLGVIDTPGVDMHITDISSTEKKDRGLPGHSVIFQIHQKIRATMKTVVTAGTRCTLHLGLEATAHCGDAHEQLVLQSKLGVQRP